MDISKERMEGAMENGVFCGGSGEVWLGSWVVGWRVWVFFLFVQRFLEDFFVFWGAWLGWGGDGLGLGRLVGGMDGGMVCACLAGLDVDEN